MSLAIIYTRAQLGITAPLVTVEVHLSNGLPAFNMVGLPETAVKESKDRVRSAIINSYFEFPQRKITVNLAPADLPKEGGRFDLAIALGILAASKQIPHDRLQHHEFIGELALSGELRRVRGCICASLASTQIKRTLIMPSVNAAEGALCRNASPLVADNLLRVCAYLHNRAPLDEPEANVDATPVYEHDLSDVKGQLHARRALEIAATGGHNILFYGPPGTGKSMLASRLPGILPPMSQDEALELAALRSIATGEVPANWRQRPFRSPHHTSSAVALVGGGSHPKPGEISLAHKGVLFLDELPEFPRKVLEVLREPIESGNICISRANSQVEYPAQFQLIAAMNPCPCGYYGDKSGRCLCSPTQVKRYRDKISGPLLDRIDLHVQVSALPLEDLQSKPAGERSELVRERVIAIHALQINRQQKPNARLRGKGLYAMCMLGSEEKVVLATAMQKLNLSARAYDRILKVARTIADMAASENIEVRHINEALAYRSLDKMMQ